MGKWIGHLETVPVTLRLDSEMSRWKTWEVAYGRMTWFRKEEGLAIV